MRSQHFSHLEPFPLFLLLRNPSWTPGRQPAGSYQLLDIELEASPSTANTLNYDSPCSSPCAQLPELAQHTCLAAMDYPLDEEDDHFLSDTQSLSDISLSDGSISGSDDEDLSPPKPVQPNFFAPPFYGRPPTPLPPSPSLTSLLRPSRPTTPDASDDDFEPVPRASPKVPTYEYYGFVLYLFSTLTFLVYLLWSFLPSPFLHALGIYYYPNRWWALAIPAFITMLGVYIYVALALYNIEILTLPLTSMETVVDDAAQVAVVDSKGRIRHGSKRRTKDKRDHRVNGGPRLKWRSVWNEGTDAVMDVPLSGVCEVLYGEGRDIKDVSGDEGWS